jgi:hypothetical protein
MDFENSYQSITKEFMEGEWWFIKKAHEKGRLYRVRYIDEFNDTVIIVMSSYLPSLYLYRANELWPGMLKTLQR